MIPYDVIPQALIAALFSFGWTTAFDRDEVFGKIGDWLDERLPEYISKPLYGCAKCNAFWVATLMYWIFWGDVWYIWLVVGACAIGINAIVLKIYSGLKEIADTIEDK